MDTISAATTPRLTLAEAAEELIRVLSHQDLAELRNTDPRDISSLHFTLGHFVRNHFSLWSKTPRVRTTFQFEDPDDLSHDILVELRKLLDQTPSVERH